jgi:hypothetical protein
VGWGFDGATSQGRGITLRAPSGARGLMGQPLRGEGFTLRAPSGGGGCLLKEPIITNQGHLVNWS